MREMEIILGLEPVGRVSEMDPLGHFRKLAKRSEADAAALARLEAALEETTLVSALTTWLERTPIMGSFYGSDGDTAAVEAYVRPTLQHMPILVRDLFSNGSPRRGQY
ncbi:MAG: hypothetical protein Ct9H90mP16_08290 [Candidatus Poseidoniales archaeon]|nr:MAG: hypothetical protein Ct9H90mP16_08290 [Candidatus Poseidoniales archaeon]